MVFFFQGPEDKGLSVLMKRLKSGKRTSEQLLLVFRERASMEEEYGKRLAKLAKNFKIFQDVGLDIGEPMNSDEDLLNGYSYDIMWNAHESK